MIVWGGYNGSVLNDGGRYNPSANTWATLPGSGTPRARAKHTAVWTGSDMIVWGGTTNLSSGGSLNEGGRYDPAANSWAATPASGAPAARYEHTAVWNGNEMIVWGGSASTTSCLNDGARYNPSANTWTALSLAGAPPARGQHTAVWTGSEMIVWGGFNHTNYFNDTWSYTPGKVMYLYMKP
jgi:N-acetylneuraminic acid mutarotase